MNHIILIGFMGAGKTTVGQALAEKLHRSFIDTDQLIEETAGMSIPAIFAEQGEDAFRCAETAVLEKLLAMGEPAVISTGGGLPLRKENREILKELGTVVYLKVSKETVLDRLKGDTTRPLLYGEDADQRVEDLLLERGPLYVQAAHEVICVDGKTVPAIIKELEERMSDQI